MWRAKWKSENLSLVGSGANVMNRVHIGDNSKVGMGAVVIHDVDAGTTVVGVPARKV